MKCTVRLENEVYKQNAQDKLNNKSSISVLYQHQKTCVQAMQATQQFTLTKRCATLPTTTHRYGSLCQSICLQTAFNQESTVGPNRHTITVANLNPRIFKAFAIT